MSLLLVLSIFAVGITFSVFVHNFMKPIKPTFKVGDVIQVKDLEVWDRPTLYKILQIGRSSYLVKPSDGRSSTIIPFYSAWADYEISKSLHPHYDRLDPKPKLTLMEEAQLLVISGSLVHTDAERSAAKRILEKSNSQLLSTIKQPAPEFMKSNARKKLTKTAKKVRK